MQQVLDAKVHKDFGWIVKVIEVRTSYKLHAVDNETMPLVVWVVVAHDANDQIREHHVYDKPLKAQRKFERLTVK